MAESKPPQFRVLAKKISRVEVVIVLILILVWLSVFVLMNIRQQEHVEKMTSLQEKILTLAADRLKPGSETQDILWPFYDTFSYCIIEGNIIIASNLDRLEGKNMTLTEAFGDFLNSQEMLKQLRMNKGGTDWIRPDKISPRQWVSWSSDTGNSHIIALVSDEEALLALSGYQGYKFLLLICACLCSALLLLALIWALSWMRLSAVKGLIKAP